MSLSTWRSAALLPCAVFCRSVPHARKTLHIDVLLVPSSSRFGERHLPVFTHDASSLHGLYLGLAVAAIVCKDGVSRNIKMRVPGCMRQLSGAVEYAKAPGQIHIVTDCCKVDKAQLGGGTITATLQEASGGLRALMTRSRCPRSSPPPYQGAVSGGSFVRRTEARQSG